MPSWGFSSVSFCPLSDGLMVPFAYRIETYLMRLSARHGSDAHQRRSGGDTQKKILPLLARRRERTTQFSSPAVLLFQYLGLYALRVEETGHSSLSTWVGRREKGRCAAYTCS